MSALEVLGWYALAGMCAGALLMILWLYGEDL